MGRKKIPEKLYYGKPRLAIVYMQYSYVMLTNAER